MSDTWYIYYINYHNFFSHLSQFPGLFVKNVPVPYCVKNICSISVNESEEIVILDSSYSPSITRISESGCVLKSIPLNNIVHEPSDFTIHENKYFIIDFKTHSIIGIGDDGGVFLKFTTANRFPTGIIIDQANCNILVSDQRGCKMNMNVYSARGILQMKFVCQYEQVKYCTGLKMLANGNIVTLDKRNNRILEFITLS